MRHRQVKVDGNAIFYREDGPTDAPVLLLPHGYPCSSYQFRRLMPALADRWRTFAPDFPGFGYSATPDFSAFGYDFDAYAGFLTAFADTLGLSRYVLWLHDYGSQIGLRHAIAHPQRITALIIQNGDVYEDVLGPKYAAIKAYWTEKTPEKHRPLEEAVSEEGFRHEFIGEVADAVAERMPPDLWKLHWPLMDTRSSSGGRKMATCRPHRPEPTNATCREQNSISWRAPATGFWKPISMTCFRWCVTSSRASIAQHKVCEEVQRRKIDGDNADSRAHLARPHPA